MNETEATKLFEKLTRGICFLLTGDSHNDKNSATYRLVSAYLEHEGVWKDLQDMQRKVLPQ